MKNKINILVKLMIATVVFMGISLVNVESAKADTTLKVNKGVTLRATELKTSKVIKVPVAGEETVSNDGNKISRGSVSKGNEVVNYAYKF